MSLDLTISLEVGLGYLFAENSSFYTQSDFVAIKAAGLNSVRIPIGYWAVDVNDEEPYVSGQYPYLIQAVYWAYQSGLTVLVDLHGAPGSQNGFDHSGLIGPVLFPTNSSNIDRSLGVLKNFSDEFSQSLYNGTVIGVELLNEPRLSNTFTMDTLKSFYSSGSSSISPSRLPVYAHDAFYGPSYWSGYTTASTIFIIDTHQYYAFSPLNNLPQATILQSVCNVSQILKTNGTPPTVVGEWSLETGNPPNASAPTGGYPDSQAKRTWLRLLFEAQLAAYSPSASGQPSQGWYYWCWKTQYDIDTWSYREGLIQAYIPSNVSNASTLVYPLLPNGCVDAGYNYTAPARAGSGSSIAASRLLVGVCLLAVLGAVGWLGAIG